MDGNGDPIGNSHFDVHSDDHLQPDRLRHRNRHGNTYRVADGDSHAHSYSPTSHCYSDPNQST
ncbi:MAG: hypothetical protein ACE5NC_04475 [Anaerolineae bacterium]